MKVTLDSNIKLEKIEWVSLWGERWRNAGRNARLGVHGKKLRVDLARITAGGITGFGMANLPKERAESLLGNSLRDMFTEDGLVQPAFFDLEFPLLDWLGQVNNTPVYKLVAGDFFQAGDAPFRVPFYDTSLYFDDLDLADDKAAVELMQNEAREGWERGHRNFKAKVGRGARFMPLQAGMQRDIAIVNGLREVIGPDGYLMVDANNGFNLNLTKEFLAATREAKVFWLEEAFHEDDQLYSDLKEWLVAENLPVLIADGEGLASPLLIDWAKAGLINIVQYDMRGFGFRNWIELGRELDKAGVRSGPHNYGVLYGNYASAHVASAIKGFAFVEWDGGFVDGLDASAYRIEDGKLVVPDKAGFGLALDDKYFAAKVSESGWAV
ncbi:MAG: mandelate racemase [Chloroflexi bacterium]|nr:mandelate racemase [Chloroflexota bacterium]OJV89513.1 MAG: mandelate racemase [Chloroflexi bacterium 54-19]